MPFIVPIFINQQGCTHRCIFCNTRLTNGEASPWPTAETISQTIHTYLGHREKVPEGEIAIYGGNFTGLPMARQEEILRLLWPYMEKGVVSGLRISTRPDEIDEEKIELIHRYKVKTVEIGAQSLDNEILTRAARGHNAEAVVKAVKILKERGFQVVIHLMMGLPGDNREKFLSTVRKTVEIHPHMVRIHPTLVLADTPLAKDFKEGTYQPLSLEEAVCWAAKGVTILRSSGIKVIRLGLQATSSLMEPGNILAGPFHPAFGALVESRIMRDEISYILEEKKVSGARVTIHTSPKKESSVRGEKSENLRFLKDRFCLKEIKVMTAKEEKSFTLEILTR